MRAWQLRRVTDPDDRDVLALATLLQDVFADPNTVLGLERLREFVAERTRERVFNAVVARQGARVVGGVVFSYVPASNCGFSEYIAVASEVRGLGLGRELFDARRELLDQQAQAEGHAAWNGLFIEADNPSRVPPDLLEHERETAIDARERLSLFAHLGFKRVDIAYVQPPLGPGKQPVSYLDLLFCPFNDEPESVEADWITRTLEPIWRRWSPDTYAAELRSLRSRLPGSTVPLQPLGER